MIIKQLKCVLLYLVTGTIMIMNLIGHAECQSVFPTQTEQVNLLTNVHELFEQIKYAAKVEQTVMNDSLIADMRLVLKNSLDLANVLEELTILKLISRSNAVCAFDAKEKIVDITKNTFIQLGECAKTANDTLTANSVNLTIVLEGAVKTGEEFLDKLNLCSEKRALAVIACYKKIIQNDVLPAKRVLAEAIENHQKGHVKAFGLKAAFNQCAEETIDALKGQLDLTLEAGLNCS